jgi:hypothetical protein
MKQGTSVEKRPTMHSRRLLCATAAFLATLLVSGGVRPAAAQASDAAERCTPDVMRLCSEHVPDADNIVECLKSKRRQLTPSCLTALQGGKPRRRRIKNDG